MHELVLVSYMKYIGIVLIGLTYWGRLTHIYVSVEYAIIDSDNGLSPAIIWTNAGLLSMRPLGTNSIEIIIEIHTFSLKKIHLKMASVKWLPFCLGPNVLRVIKSGPIITWSNITPCNTQHYNEKSRSYFELTWTYLKLSGHQHAQFGPALSYITGNYSMQN